MVKYQQEMDICVYKIMVDPLFVQPVFVLLFSANPF